MQEYRVYKLGTDGKIWSPPEIIKCIDDSAAIAHAKQLLNGAAIEVWQTARRIVHLDPIHPPPLPQPAVRARAAADIEGRAESGVA